MKKNLITGGASFVGSHLCKRLLAEGNEVICLDNYFTGAKANILELLGHPYFEMVRIILRNPIMLRWKKFII
jgi:UDP-glucuronate decarboxylase